MNIYYIELLKCMTLPFSNSFAFLDFSKNRLATHELPSRTACVWTQFSRFPMNRLVVEGDPPGDAYCVAQFFLFVGLSVVSLCLSWIFVVHIWLAWRIM